MKPFSRTSPFSLDTITVGESTLYQLLCYTAVAFIDLLYSLITLWLKT